MDTSNEIIWNPSDQHWHCPFCHHTQFYQTVIAKNAVALTTGNKTTLVESDDFSDSWEVTDRQDVRCRRCDKLVAIQDNVVVVERWEWNSLLTQPPVLPSA